MLHQPLWGRFIHILRLSGEALEVELKAADQGFFGRPAPGRCAALEIGQNRATPWSAFRGN